MNQKIEMIQDVRFTEVENTPVNYGIGYAVINFVNGAKSKLESIILN